MSAIPYRIAFPLLIALLAFRVVAEDSPPSISDKTESMQKFEGYFPYYWEESSGKTWLEISRLNNEFLYVSSLATGLGSNDIGLDRAQLGGTRVVKFERVGPKVLMVQPNYDYRATSDNPLEVRAAEDAFATSVVWGFTVGAEEEGRVLVDATEFFLRDAHNVTGTLKRSGQGTYSLEKSRSALYLPRTKNFPENSEFEATLTFTGNPEGAYVRAVSPDARSITLRQHHSFIQLPDDEYTPRRFDPRSGMFPLTYVDYGVAIDQPIEQRFVRRHRLKKINPERDVSEAVEPIVYYLDAGTPEPIRSALLEGASWWNQAYEAIGYRNAFQVRLMPEDADPMDVRYNTVTWVHRATRGWSYGSSVTDPRTGEIIKGHVTLGSLRVRQDFLIASGLKALYAGESDTDPAVELALARLRQLSTHEIGHTLGFAHNFAASTNGRASVMDYPPPRIGLDSSGAITFEDAYDVGIGEWDKVTVAYGYSEFPEGTDEKAALSAILMQANQDGLRFISDSDARPPGGAHPHAHLWDDGNDVIQALNDALAVREVALQNFSEANIAMGSPLANLEETLVPIYLFHRYQTEGVAKIVGGVHYDYAIRGGGKSQFESVAGDTQRRALDALLDTVAPEALQLPEHIVNLIPPRAFGHPRHRELFDGRSGPVLDSIAIAEIAAQHTLRLLLHPQRAERLLQQHSRDGSMPGLHDVLDRVVDETWKSKSPKNGLTREVKYAVDNLVLQNLFRLAGNENASTNVREVTRGALTKLERTLRRSTGSREGEHRAFGRSEIARFLEDGASEMASEPFEQPPGSPIGFIDQEFCSMGNSLQ